MKRFAEKCPQTKFLEDYTTPINNYWMTALSANKAIGLKIVQRKDVLRAITHFSDNFQPSLLGANRAAPSNTLLFR